MEQSILIVKIKTIEQLQDLIDSELSWRKKELTAIKSGVNTSRKFAQNTAIRSGIAMVYAHWEGAIKNMATYYLSYVAFQRHKYYELKENFLALAIKTQLQTFQESKKATIHNSIIQLALDNQNQNTRIPYKDVISTNSNLNSEIFMEIMATIGLDDSGYKSSYNLIDEALLKLRNEIAHGERLEALSLDVTRFEEIHKRVWDLIDKFSVQVINAAVMKQYKKSI